MVPHGRGFHSLSDGWRVSPLPSPSQMCFFSQMKRLSAAILSGASGESLERPTGSPQV